VRTAVSGQTAGTGRATEATRWVVVWQRAKNTHPAGVPGKPKGPQQILEAK